MNKAKRQVNNLKEAVAMHLANKGFISKICNRKKTSNPIEKQAKYKNKNRNQNGLYTHEKMPYLINCQGNAKSGKQLPFHTYRFVKN